MGAENGRENGVGSCVGKQTKFVVILMEFQLRIDTEVWVEIWFRWWEHGPVFWIGIGRAAFPNPR